MGAIAFSIDEKLLCFFCDHLALRWFIETGTFEGESVALAARKFARCISVELSESYYQKAVVRFRGVTNVELYCGQSPEVLQSLSVSLQQEPGLFWLDAHWCVAENTAGADSQSPLLGELSGIGKLHPQSVILIDDARLYLCAPPHPHRYQDWPGLSEIFRALNALSATHVLSVFNDVIAFYPQAIAKDFNQFAYANGVDWLGIVVSQQSLLAARAPRKDLSSSWKRFFRLVRSR